MFMAFVFTTHAHTHAHTHSIDLCTAQMAHRMLTANTFLHRAV